MSCFPAALVAVLVATGGAEGEPRAAEQAATPAAAASAGDAGFETALEKGSYAVGFSFGSAMRRRKLEIVPEHLIAGVRDALSGRGGRISDQEAEVLNRQIQAAAHRRQQEERDALSAKNKAEGEAYLASNKDRPGVVTLPSGLQYEVVRAASGPRPAPDDTVHVHYRGTLIDGSPVHSSYERGQEAVLRPDGVIPAWTEALPMMSVGSKWKLYVPPDLGYEKIGVTGPNIPPGATLIYEVELLSIRPKAVEAPPPAAQKP